VKPIPSYVFDMIVGVNSRQSLTKLLEMNSIDLYGCVIRLQRYFFYLDLLYFANFFSNLPISSDSFISSTNAISST